MPRKLPVEYAGTLYDVMSRRDRRQDIFLDDVDRQDFLKMLAEACQAYKPPARIPINADAITA